MNWIEIASIQELESVLPNSNIAVDKGTIFFKHSTRCGTSRMAYQMFNKEWGLETPVYLVNVVENRAVSNELAHRSQISHESPQVLVFKGDRCIFNASHYEISANDVAKVLQLTEPAG